MRTATLHRPWLGHTPDLFEAQPVSSAMAFEAAFNAWLASRQSAARLLMSQPDWRFANSADKTPLPECLSEDAAARLVDWLLRDTGHTHGHPTDHLTIHTTQRAVGDWQQLRNRAAVGLQLGAGLTPADVRAAECEGLRLATGTDKGTAAGLPFAIRIPSHGACAEREAPIAPWAGQLLALWLATRAAMPLHGRHLFPAARDGRPWGKVAQYNAARQVLAAAGLPPASGGSFVLRHTFAVRQLRHGAAETDVARWLGLADTLPLQRYRPLVLAPVGVV